MSTVQDMIDLLMDIENKNLPFVIETDLGFRPMCPANSVVEVVSDGSEVFILCPCFCHAEDEAEDVLPEIVFDVRAEDSDFCAN